MDQNDRELPLAGLRVLDFAQFLAGPVAALRLSDMGAEVIKIERPQGGDLCRSMVVNNQVLDGDSLVFHTFNRSKKSVAADLKNPGDLQSVKELIKTADVMIHNFRPGVMERVGLGYNNVRTLNPRMIYAAVSGYGTTGPLERKPGQDLLVQALSGIAWLNGDDGQGPIPTGFAMLDVATAGNLVQGILACLIRRGVSGKGALVEVDLLSSAFDLTFEQFTCFLNDDNKMPRRHASGNANPYQPAPYGVYKTADGFIAVAMAPIAKIAELLDLPTLNGFSQEEAFLKLDEIKAIIADTLDRKPTDHWVEMLEEADIWCAPVLQWPEFVRSDAFSSIEVVQSIPAADGSSFETTYCPIRINGARFSNKAAAPRLGEHTSELSSMREGAKA